MKYEWSKKSRRNYTGKSTGVSPPTSVSKGESTPSIYCIGQTYPIVTALQSYQ